MTATQPCQRWRDRVDRYRPVGCLREIVGASYAYRRLLEAGAPARAWGEDPAAYVERALASGAFRRVRYPRSGT